MTSLSHLLCVCLAHITTQSRVRLIELVSCVCTCVCSPVCVCERASTQACTRFSVFCACECVCLQPSLKAFKQERERVWNPGMTSLSMMSFLQGDFDTCDRLGEVTLSLLTHRNSRSPLQIEQCQI